MLDFMVIDWLYNGCLSCRIVLWFVAIIEAEIWLFNIVNLVFVSRVVIFLQNIAQLTSIK